MDDVGQNVVFVVVGRQLGQALVGLVAAQADRVLCDENVWPLRDWLAEGDELELGGVKRGGQVALAVAQVAVGVVDGRAVASRRDGDHVVLVAVHVHPLEEPGVARPAVGDTDAVFHGAEGAAEAATEPQGRRAVHGVHRLDVGEPGADGELA